jgi:hypothetical protein
VVKHMHGRVSVAHAVDRYYPLDCSNKSWLTAFLLSVECGQRFSVGSQDISRG